MKRFALLTILVLSICLVGYAEELDLASMTTDDLIELRNQINNEIDARVETKDGLSLFEGYYTVGIDIAAGAYEIKDWTEPDDSQYREAWVVYVYPSQEKLDEYAAAKKEYDIAYEAAQDSEESGEDVSYPDFVDITNYLDDRVVIASGKTNRVKLSDGQVMRVYRSLGDADLTITQSGSLFID